MKYAYHIKNGRVIDPARGLDCLQDVYVLRSKIAEPPADDSCAVEEVIDAAGCLVFPGIVDSHAHLDYRHSDYSIPPDTATFPNGITSAVDAGSTGSSNFEGFYRDIVCRSATTVKSFLNVTATGVMTLSHNEITNPDIYDVNRLQYLFEMYPDFLLGLKLRMGKGIGSEYGLRPLIRTKEIASQIGTSVNVHVVNPEHSYSEILSYFEKGDILCHCFQNKNGPHTILENGKISAVAKDARARGVLFEAAGGRTLYDIRVIRAALAEGFLPDMIGADVTTTSYLRPSAHSILYAMTFYLAIGMPLSDLIRAMTETPARVMGLSGVIGTLAPGAMADISIMRLREKPVAFRDFNGNTVNGSQIFVPQMTIKAGKPVYRQIESIF